MFERVQRYFEDEDRWFRKSMERRQERLERSARTPVLAGLSRLFFNLTVFSTAICVVGETGSWLKLGTYDARHWLDNLSFSALAFWMLFGLATILFSAARLNQIKLHGLPPEEMKEEPEEVNEDDPPWRKKYFRRKKESCKLYTKRMGICAAGTVILGVFYMLVHL